MAVTEVISQIEHYNLPIVTQCYIMKKYQNVQIKYTLMHSYSIIQALIFFAKYPASVSVLTQDKPIQTVIVL